MKFSEFVAKLTPMLEAEKDKEAIDVLHNHLRVEVFQPIFDKGHATGATSQTSSVTEATRKLTEAEGKLAEAERKLTELQSANPNAAELQQKYQDDLAKIQREHTEALRLKDEAITNERRERAKGELIHELVDVHKVDKVYAEVLADHADNKSRMRFNAEGKLEVLQKGKDIAIVPSSEKGVVAMFAEELKAGVDPKFITSTASAGSEVNSSGGQGAGAGGDVFANIRKGEKARQEAAGKTHGTDTVAARLGIRTNG